MLWTTTILGLYEVCNHLNWIVPRPGPAAKHCSLAELKEKKGLRHHSTMVGFSSDHRMHMKLLVRECWLLLMHNQGKSIPKSNW